MPKTIQLPFDLPDVEVLSTEARADGALIIRVESTLKTTRCRVCGREIDRLHGHDKAIELRHLPILDREVYIRTSPSVIVVRTVRVGRPRPSAVSGTSRTVDGPRHTSAGCCGVWSIRR